MDGQASHLFAVLHAPTTRERLRLPLRAFRANLDDPDMFSQGAATDGERRGEFAAFVYCNAFHLRGVFEGMLRRVHGPARLSVEDMTSLACDLLSCVDDREFDAAFAHFCRACVSRASQQQVFEVAFTPWGYASTDGFVSALPLSLPGSITIHELPDARRIHAAGQYPPISLQVSGALSKAAAEALRAELRSMLQVVVPITGEPPKPVNTATPLSVLFVSAASCWFLAAPSLTDSQRLLRDAMVLTSLAAGQSDARIRLSLAWAAIASLVPKQEGKHGPVDVSSWKAHLARLLWADEENVRRAEEWIKHRHDARSEFLHGRNPSVPEHEADDSLSLAFGLLRGALEWQAVAAASAPDEPAASHIHEALKASFLRQTPLDGISGAGGHLAEWAWSSRARPVPPEVEGP